MLNGCSMAAACREAGIPRGTYWHLRRKREQYLTLGFRDLRERQFSAFEQRVVTHMQDHSTLGKGSCAKLLKQIAKDPDSGRVPSAETIRRFLRRADNKFKRGEGYQYGRWYSNSDPRLYTSAIAVPQTQAPSRQRASLEEGAPRARKRTRQRVNPDKLRGLKRKIDRLEIVRPILNLVENHRSDFRDMVIRAAAEVVHSGPIRVKAFDPSGEEMSPFSVDPSSHSWVRSPKETLVLAYRLNGSREHEWAEIEARAASKSVKYGLMGNVDSAYRLVAHDFARWETLPAWAEPTWSALELEFKSLLEKEAASTGTSLDLVAAQRAVVEQALRPYFQGKLVRRLGISLRQTLREELRAVVEKMDESRGVLVADPVAPERLPAAPYSLDFLFWTIDVPKALNDIRIRKESAIPFHGPVGIHGKRAFTTLATHATGRELVEHLERKGIPGEKLLLPWLSALLEKAKRARQIGQSGCRNAGTEGI